MADPITPTQTCKNRRQFKLFSEDAAPKEPACQKKNFSRIYLRDVIDVMDSRDEENLGRGYPETKVKKLESLFSRTPAMRGEQLVFFGGAYPVSRLTELVKFGSLSVEKK